MCFASCSSLSLGRNGFLMGLFDVVSVIPRVFSRLRDLADFSWGIGVSASLDT